MPHHGKESGELSERDLDLRRFGVEGLAILDLLIEGEAEAREEELVKKLQELSAQVLENGIKDVVSLPFINDKLNKEDFGKLLRLNPQYACEYVAGLFRYIAEDFLKVRPMNVRDLEFNLTDRTETASLDDVEVSPIKPEGLSQVNKDSFTSLTMIVGAIQYLIQFQLVTNEEFEQVKKSI